MPMTTAEFADLLNPIFQKIVSDAIKNWKWQYERFFNKVTPEAGKYYTSGITGFGLVPIKGEGESMTEDVRYQKYDGYIQSYFRGRYYSITKEMQKRELFGKMKESWKSMLHSYKYSKELVFANLFNYGTVTTYTSGPDGKAMFATDHPRADGGSDISNLETSTTPSDSALWTMRNNFLLQVNHRGLLVMHEPQMVMTCVQQERNFKEWLKSRQKAGTANNDLNVWLEEQLELVIWPMLTSSTGFTMLPAKEYMELYDVAEQEPEKLMDTDFKTQNIMTAILGAFGAGYGETINMRHNVGT